MKSSVCYEFSRTLSHLSLYTDFTLNIFISAISQCTDQKPQIYNYRYFRDTLKISILDDGMLFGFGFPLCIDGNLAFNFTEKNVTITVRFFILRQHLLTHMRAASKEILVVIFSGQIRKYAFSQIVFVGLRTIREHLINSDLVSSFGFQRMPLVCFKAVDYVY